MDIETIHESLVNGQRRQMAKQIDEYGAADFFESYRIYLDGLCVLEAQIKWFTDAVISYHRIKER